MKEPLPSVPTGEPEETLVTPRFDEVETVQAQPVVPFAEVPPGARGVARRSRASWPLALVLVSALVGVVVGGAGLYFYQNRSTENASADAPPTTSEAPPEATPSAEESASLPPQEAEPTDSETNEAEIVSAEVVEPTADDAKKEEAAKAPAPEPRKAAEPGDDSSGSNRGRREEREAEPARRTPRAERVGSREEARDDDDDGEPQPRLSDEIIYPRDRRAQRRAERRERRANRQRSVDRVRGIFEGQPE